MFLGHYALALAAKRVAPQTSLGTTILAAQFLDLLWPILLLLGYERVRIAPGMMAANGLDFVHYPISHSLLTAAGWALLLGLGYHALRRSARGASAVGGLVLSHWFLDLPMHRPDLPLWPGSETQVGAGLWDSVAATLALELGLLAIGVAVYLRATRATDRVGRWGLWSLLALLVVFFLSGTFGPPPPSEQALAVGGLALWLLVAWGYWVDRHRSTVPAAPARERPARSPARVTGRGRRAFSG
jgi:hypothetical protein